MPVSLPPLRRTNMFSAEHPTYFRQETLDAQIIESISQGKYSIKNTVEPRLVFDLGCHLGAWSRQMLLQFPDVHIVGVEPGLENLQLYSLNMQHADPNKVRIVPKYIGYEGGVTMVFANSDRAEETGSGGPTDHFQAGDATVVSTTVSELVDLYGCPDIIKVNFGDHDEWSALDSVSNDPRLSPYIVARLFDDDWRNRLGDWMKPSGYTLRRIKEGETEVGRKYGDVTLAPDLDYRV